MGLISFRSVGTHAVLVEVGIPVLHGNCGEWPETPERIMLTSQRSRASEPIQSLSTVKDPIKYRLKPPDCIQSCTLAASSEKRRGNASAESKFSSELANKHRKRTLLSDYNANGKADYSMLP